MNSADIFDCGSGKNEDSSFESNHVIDLDTFHSLNNFNGRNNYSSMSKNANQDKFLCAALRSDNSIKLFNIQNQAETEIPELIQVDLSPNPGLNKVKCLRFETYDSLVYCGYDMNTCRFDLEKGKISWKSKESERDELNLKKPIKNHSLVIDSQKNLIWVSSNLHGLTCLAPSQQKKPVRKIEFKQGETRARGDKIAISKSGDLVYCSDTLGQLYIYDTRKPKTAIRKITNSLASLEEIALSDDGRILGTIGLDRFLRVYQTPEESSEMRGSGHVMVCEKYMKTRLTSLIIESKCSSILTDRVEAIQEKITTKNQEKNLGKRKELEVKIHKKDKYDIEKVFPTRKQALNIKLRNRIREKVKREIEVKRIKKN